MSELIIIGAGPAGMAAASTASRHGVDCLLIDEAAAPGGQIYRAIEQNGGANRQYARGLELAAEFRGSAAKYLPATTVWQIEPGFDVFVRTPDATQKLQTSKLLLATGALERPVPIAGWTLPGVMTVGAAQILLKTSKMLPQPGTWIAGSGPLPLLYATQVLEAGGQIDGFIDTTPAGLFGRAWPHALGALGDPGSLAQGLLWRSRLKIIKGRTIAAEGNGRLETIVVDGRRIPASLLLLHEGVVPNIHAAMSVGCATKWDEAQRCFRPQIDVWGQSSVDGVFIAGDGTGIVGVQAAETRGRLTGLAIASALGKISAHERDRLAAPLLKQLKRQMRIRPLLDAVFTPRPALRSPSDDTLVCRCESVSAGAIRTAVGQGYIGPNQVKAVTRCGMGPCQGRMCGLSVTEIIAAERQVDPADVGFFRIRPPLKSLTLGEIADLAKV